MPRVELAEAQLRAVLACELELIEFAEAIGGTQPRVGILNVAPRDLEEEIATNISRLLHNGRVGALPINIIDGDRSAKNPKRDEFQDRGVLFLNTTNIVDDRLDLTSANFISEEKYSTISKGRLQPLDIVMTNPDGEGALETNTIALFESLGWHTANCCHETCGELSTRESSEQVVLEFPLREAIAKLNPGLS